MGQWKHPGENTRIPSNNITMKGVNYPVLGVSNNGHEKMMYPGEEYTFPGAKYVDEFPQLKSGGRTRGLIPMPKPSKKGLASKKYSRSLEATNRLFTENKLFKKPKSKKNKVFDPNAKYYQTGGFIDLELDDKEIAQYVKGGYVVEDVSVPSLTKAQEGGSPKSKWIAPVDIRGYSKVDPVTKLVYKNLEDFKVKAGKKGFKNRVKSFFQKDLGKLTKEAEELGKGVGYIAGVQGDIEPAVYNREGLNKFKSEVKKLKGDFNKDLKAAEKERKEALDNKAEYDKWKKKLDNNEISASEFLLKGKGKGWEVYNDAKVAKGTGPDAAYSAKEAEANAMKNVPEFVDMVSKVATAIPLLGGAGALAGSVGSLATTAGRALAPAATAAGKVIFNPVTQGILAAPALAQMALHPVDTVTGAATTGVELYDKAMGDKDDVNRFGDPYWQDVNHLVNTAALLPGISSLKALRELSKTKKGFDFAVKYIKPAKDFYKKGVRKYIKTTAPVLNTNIPRVAAGVADSVTGGRGATEVVNRAGQLLQNVPEWANPTVGNTLKGIGYLTAANTGIEGAGNVQKGLSEGNKEKFDAGIAKTVDAVTTLATFTDAPEIAAATQPLVVLATANELKDNIAKDETGSTAYNTARIINQIAGLPTSSNQILPRQSVRALRRLKVKHIRKNLKKGGIVSELSQKEIDDLIAQGYIIEELD